MNTAQKGLVRNNTIDDQQRRTLLFTAQKLKSQNKKMRNRLVVRSCSNVGVRHLD